MKKSFLILLLMLGSCQKRGMDTASMFTRQGELKEKIAFVSMINSSGNNLSWDVSAELSQYLARDIARKDTLYVIPVGDEIKLSKTKNPFSKNLHWLNDQFSHAQYVAFTELLKYEESKESDPNLSHSLDISVRVRLFENTPDGFKVILQEIVQESYMIPSLFSKDSSLQPSYNTPGYEISPVGVAHQNFSQLLAKRIRDYIK